jgi:hypothetical protein
MDIWSRFRPRSPSSAESEGYKPADFDNIKISGEGASTVEIDEDILVEAMPDFAPFCREEIKAR